MATNQPAGAVTKADWSGFWVRTQRSCIRTLDFARIFLFDGGILALGKGVVYISAKLGAPGNKYLEAAHTLSQMLFLLLYVITVCVDVVEYILEQRHQS
jgi:hypothetical protein